MTARFGGRVPSAGGRADWRAVPPNLLLHRLLPPLLVITASIVLHYLLAGAGLAYFARRCGLSTTASYWGAIVFCLGSGIAHLSHISVLATMAWLPWMLALTRALLQPRIAKSRWMHAGGLVLVSALQFLAGHPSNLAPELDGRLCLRGVVVSLLWHERVLYRRSTLWLGCLLASVIVGALQLLPTLQLSALSQEPAG